MEKELKDWIEDNLLQVVQDGDLLRIDEVGTFYLLQEADAGLIHHDMTFNLDDEEVYRIEHLKPDYLLFSFGGRYYYCKTQLNEEDHYKVSFNDFRYLGKARSSNPTVPFVHLGIHSEYELLNGSGNLATYCKKAKFLGMKAVGICDRNTLAGTLPLQFAAEKEGLKPVFGMTAVVAYDYDPHREHQITFELKLYVTCKQGWQNLLRINKAINVDYDGFIPEQELINNGEGLVAVLSTYSFVNSDYYDEKACLKRILQYKKWFKDVYYQVDTVEYYEEKQDRTHLLNLQRYFSNFKKLVQPILISDSYYVDHDMYRVKDYLNKVEGVISDYSEDQYFKSYDQNLSKFAPLFPAERFTSWFAKIAENTTVLLAGCTFEIDNRIKLPRYEFAKGETNEEMFFRLIQEGWELKIAGKVEDEELYAERVQTEAEVIMDAGLVDYFLIIWDIIYWAKQQGVLVGYGRGSIAGSLIAYLLHITEVDPIKYDLMFERFLNATRAKHSLPDVDSDFPMEARDSIKRYISEKFGEMHVCSIGAYGRLKLKAGVKDFGRVHGLKFAHVNYITKNIDHKLEYTFSDFVSYAAQSKELQQFFQKNPTVIHCVKDALGQARSTSIHASGVVIVPKQDFDGNPATVFDWMPVRKMDGVLVSEWEGKYIEKAGFLKEDILGLKQLDKFKATLRLIRKNRKKTIELTEIPLNCPKTYKLFSKGWTEDVFQFTSAGLKHYSHRVKPTHIEDLIAMSALYRPGPMGSKSHEKFADLKNKVKGVKVEYDYGLKSVTEKTYGVYVYQEQIMQAVVVLGGMSLVESDTFRQAIKKFDKKTMASYEEKFITGAIKNGCPPKEAKLIWEKLLKFSGYGFNKCISGDALIYRFTGNQHLPKEITVEQFYNLKTNKKKSCYKKFKKQGHLGLVRHYNPELKKVQYAKVKDIHYNGFKEVFELRLKNGMSIKATWNHRLMTVDGQYKELIKLKVGDKLMCCGDKIEDWEKSYKPTGEGQGWNKGGNIGERKDGRTIHFFNAKKHAFMRSGGDCEVCKVKGHGRMEYHHCDGDRLNNRFENVIYVCNSCHKKLDYELGLKHGNRDLGYYAVTSEIVSKTLIGKEDVYDLEMFDEPHNFIANGIVSHNSHSAAYSLISYHCQYLKQHYPLEFWTASLQYTPPHVVPNRISEMKKQAPGIRLQPPDINKSGLNFTCDKERDFIFWSFLQIKGIGQSIAKKIIEERKANGKFKSFEDFVARRVVAKDKLLKLILAGAFDILEGNTFKPEGRYRTMEKYCYLYDLKMDAQMKEKKNSRVYWIVVGKELTGLGDIDFKGMIGHKDPKLSKLYLDPVDFQEARNKRECCIAGQVMFADERLTKKGDPYFTFTIVCNNEILFSIFWKEQYELHREAIDQIKRGEMICISGQVKMDSWRGCNILEPQDDTKLFKL